MDHKINVWPQNIKLLEENIGETFRLWIWWWFLGYDTKGIGNRRKNRQMDFIEMKNIHQKVQSSDRQPEELENIFENDVADKGLIS